MRSRIGTNPTPTPKRRLLHLAQKGLYWSGIPSVRARFCSRWPATVLMYHSVSTASDARWIAPRNRINPQTFERHIRFLARRRHVIGIDQFVDHLDSGHPVSEGTVVLTFDDGYLDNWLVAAPILKRYGLPAVIYLCTGYLNTAENQWADVLYSIFTHRNQHRLSIDKIGDFDLRCDAQEMSAYTALGGCLLTADHAGRAGMLDDVTDQLQPRACPPRLTMTWDEARRLVEEYPNLTLGIHTADHLDLSRLEVEDALSEIDKSIEHYQNELGFPPVHFSCPYSRTLPGAIGCLPERGIRSAMTTVGTNDPHAVDRMDLNRLKAPRSLSLLRYWTSGAHPRLTEQFFGRS